VEGTVAHALAERAFKYHFLPDTLLGRKCFVHQDGSVVSHPEPGTLEVAVTEEMVSGVNLYVDTVRRLWSDDWGPGCFPTLYVEKRVALGSLCSDLYGTADAVLVGEDRLCIVDFKFGRKPVEADCNQLRAYAACALQTFDVSATAAIDLFVVQPRALHEEGPVRRYSTTAADVQKWTHDVLLPAIKKTTRLDAPLVAGDHCTFCKGLSRCPAVAKKAEETSLAAFSSTPVSWAEITLPPAHRLSDEKLASILAAAPLFRSWLDAVEQEVTHRLREGGEVPGFTLEERRTHRKWKDPEQAAGILTELIGVAVLERKLKSPAQVERIIKNEGLGEKILDFVSSLCEKPAGEFVARPIGKNIKKEKKDV
jgi:hypothetical protein